MSYYYHCLLCQRKTPALNLCNCDGSSRPQFKQPYHGIACEVIEYLRNVLSSRDLPLRPGFYQQDIERDVAEILERGLKDPGKS